MPFETNPLLKTQTCCMGFEYLKSLVIMLLGDLLWYLFSLLSVLTGRCVWCSSYLHIIRSTVRSRHQSVGLSYDEEMMNITGDDPQWWSVGGASVAWVMAYCVTWPCHADKPYTDTLAARNSADTAMSDVRNTGPPSSACRWHCTSHDIVTFWEDTPRYSVSLGLRHLSHTTAMLTMQFW